jgi:hypothetical protein
MITHFNERDVVVSPSAKYHLYFLGFLDFYRRGFPNILIIKEIIFFINSNDLRFEAILGRVVAGKWR